MAIVQTLWIGDRLSKLELLSLKSYLSHGHEVHLYSYQQFDNLPPDVISRDANEILPASMIFKYHDVGSYSGFANLFRYKLLLERGGWWTDLDIVCLRPLPKINEFVFATELKQSGQIGLTNCAIYSKPKSGIIQFLYETARAKDPAKIVWCETGPPLLDAADPKFELSRHKLTPEAFCPVPFHRWYDTFLPGRAGVFGEQTYGVHFWHEMWRRANLDKDEDYGPRSLFEILKRRYGVV